MFEPIVYSTATHATCMAKKWTKETTIVTHAVNQIGSISSEASTGTSQINL
jgi:hypothetical protein